MKKQPNEKHSQKKRSRTPKDVTVGSDTSVGAQGVCTKAPEWAEHHRLWDDDEPCDDGRSGTQDD